MRIRVLEYLEGVAIAEAGAALTKSAEFVNDWRFHAEVTKAPFPFPVGEGRPRRAAATRDRLGTIL